MVVIGVVKIVGKAGVDPADAIFGASQGIIQGAAEVKIDLGVATLETIAAAKKVAAQTGLSEILAVSRATEGALQAAKAIGIDAFAQVQLAIEENHLANQPLQSL